MGTPVLGPTRVTFRVPRRRLLGQKHHSQPKINSGDILLVYLDIGYAKDTRVSKIGKYIFDPGVSLPAQPANHHVRHFCGTIRDSRLKGE